MSIGCGTLICSQDDAGDLPFSSGFQCVQAPLRRPPMTLTGGTVGGNNCTGIMTRDFSAWIASGADPARVSGVEVWAQVYSRDPGFAPPNNVNLTEALDFVVHNGTSANRAGLRPGARHDASMSRAHTPSLFPDAEVKPKAPVAKRLAFDIEIANVFELAPGEDLERHGPFDISCAAIATDRGEVRHWFKQDAAGKPLRCLDAEGASDLLGYLRNAQLAGVQVFAWNGLSFDVRWLGWAARDMRLAAQVALDLYDPMFQFVVQRGFPIGLAAVADGLGLEQKKLMHGSDAPKEWAAGNHARVLEYVAGDCQITERVAARIAELGEVRWRTKKGGVSSEPMPKLERVRDLLHRPQPDVSWMSEPIRREKFYEWLVQHAELQAHS